MPGKIRGVRAQNLIQVRGIIVETGGTLLGPPGHETPKGQGGVPRWNGPKTVRTLRRRQSLTARPKASGKQWEREEEVQFVALAGGTSRRSPPCSRRHALVTVHASFLVDEVVRQVRPASSLCQRCRPGLDNTVAPQQYLG